MPQRRRALLLLVLTAIVATLGAIAVAVSREDRVIDGLFRGVGRRAPTEAESAAIAACGKLGWEPLVEVIEQDLDVACPAGFIPDELARNASKRWLRWLGRIAADPARPPRTRLRAGLAVVAATGVAPSGLGVLLDDPIVGRAERERLLATWTDGAPDWATPDEADDQALAAYVDGDLARAWVASDRLRTEAELLLLTPEGREALVDHALTPVGFGGKWLAKTLERRGRGLPIADLPRRELGLVDTGIDACQARSSPACLRFAADLLDARIADDPDTSAPIEAPTPARAPIAVLWAVAWNDDDAVDAALRRFDAAGAWIAAAPPEDRPRRLLALIAHPRHGLAADHARAVVLGDPLVALALRRASPWATAAAAQRLGELASVPVEVSSLGDGVVLRVGDHRVGIGPCGAHIVPPEQSGVAWSVDHVLAEAAIERAGTALRAGEAARALRLTGLAETLDPIGAHGVNAIARDRSGLDPAGLVAGGLLLASIAHDGPDRAIREQRADLWEHTRVEWNQAGRPDCPSPLGP